MPLCHLYKTLSTYWWLFRQVRRHFVK